MTPPPSKSETSAPPRQAVILAGGRGSRLRPFTDKAPKPMVPFHGRPFLEYLVEMLAGQGIERILMLLGYLPDAIRGHFGDGRSWGVAIDYSVTPAEDETGRRLKRAVDRLDATFLMLYCDNYLPFDLAAAWAHRETSGAAAQITVYRNADGYTRDNLRVAESGLVTAYDRNRTAPGLSGVDVGFAFIDRSVVEDLPGDNISFESYAYPRLVKAGRLGAFVMDHRYYSIGSPDRLPATGLFLARQPTVLIDRDGVLNRSPGKARYVRSWDEWEWLPGALEALQRLHSAGVRSIIVTNQSGIGRGLMSEDDLAAIHARMRSDVRAAGGAISAIYHCPHGWDDGCDCRKPKPGMMFAAQRAFHLDLSRVPMVGDDVRDFQAARAAGCPALMVDAETQLIALVPKLVEMTLG